MLKQLCQAWGIDEILLSKMARSWKGDRRSLSLRPHFIHSEFNQNQTDIRLSFQLDKGSYATTILTELIQPNQPFQRMIGPPN